MSPIITALLGIAGGLYRQVTFEKQTLDLLTAINANLEQILEHQKRIDAIFIGAPADV